MIPGNQSTKVDERGNANRGRALNKDLELSTPATPAEDGNAEEARGRRKSQGLGGKAQTKETLSGTKSSSQTNAPLVAGRKPTMVKLKNVKGTSQRKDEVNSSTNKNEDQISPKRTQLKAKR